MDKSKRGWQTTKINKTAVNGLYRGNKQRLAVSKMTANPYQFLGMHNLRGYSIMVCSLINV
jgi:hypothetical protein